MQKVDHVVGWTAIEFHVIVATGTPVPVRAQVQVPDWYLGLMSTGNVIVEPSTSSTEDKSLTEKPWNFDRVSKS